MISPLRELFERNVKDTNLLGRWFTNYRVPHEDKDGNHLEVGDEVRCEWKGSWIDRKSGIVMKLGVHTDELPDGGHLLQMHDCVTVAPVNTVTLKERSQNHSHVAAADRGQGYTDAERCPNCDSINVVQVTPARPGPDGWGWRCRRCGHTWPLEITPPGRPRPLTQAPEWGERRM